MLQTIKLLGIIAAASLVLTVLSACESPRRDSEPGAAAPSEAAPAAETVEAAGEEEKAKEEAAKGEEAEDEAKKARERERKLAKLERDLEVAGLKLSKEQLASKQAEIQFEESLAKAMGELGVAKQKLDNLREVSAPQRVAWAELGLQRAEDRFTEAQEELEQLELMYSDEQFADKTKEIVVERARRQLERSRRDLELRKKDLDTLVKVTIPLETTEHELGVQEKERALQQVRRNHETAMLDKQVGVLNAEAEIVRLENELADVKEEIEEARQKDAEKKAAEKKEEKAGQEAE
jgi:hypothetical protein